MMKYADLIKKKSESADLDKKDLEQILEELLVSIGDTLKELKDYKPSDLKFIYDEYDNGFTIFEFDSYGDTVDEALYNLLDSHLSIEDLQFQFVFINKNGAEMASKLHLVELQELASY